MTRSGNSSRRSGASGPARRNSRPTASSPTRPSNRWSACAPGPPRNSRASRGSAPPGSNATARPCSPRSPRRANCPRPSPPSGPPSPPRRLPSCLDRRPSAPRIDRCLPLAMRAPTYIPTEEWTWRLLDRGFTLDEAAAIRGLDQAAIIRHAALMARQGRLIAVETFLTPDVIRRWDAWWCRARQRPSPPRTGDLGRPLGLVSGLPDDRMNDWSRPPIFLIIRTIVGRIRTREPIA